MRLPRVESDPVFDYASAISSSVAVHQEQLIAVGKIIYSHPERALHEFIAHDTICGLFDTLNKSATTPYRITRHAYQTPTNRLTTAFEIETFSGDGGLLVVFNAEYDALPAPTELRHACGHNLIATASAAAFISATSALRASGAKNWRLRLLGTPAEEAAGGKLKLLKQGAYREAAACVMVHPVPLFPTQDGVSWTSSLASQRVSVVFDGKPSHGALAPWEGRNALDAFVNAYVSISTLRQQLMPHQRICGIITEGGVAANVIPSVAKAQFSVRSKNKEELDALMGKVKTCLMAGAVSSGCEATITVGNPYLNMRSNVPMCREFVRSMKVFGRHFVEREERGAPRASTDQGNVSYACPSIQPVFSICTKESNHTAPFADTTNLPDSYARALSCAKGLAAVAIRVVVDYKFAEAVRLDFEMEG